MNHYVYGRWQDSSDYYGDESENESNREQRHVHEVLGSVMIAEPEEDPHNHRFATVTGQAILTNNGRDHYHEVDFRTDFYEEHFHRFHGRTSGAVGVGDRHVHFIDDAVTTFNDGHRHEFRLATMLDDPIGD